MSVGDEAKAALPSYLAIGKESTYGTYASATTAVEFLSSSIRTDIASQKIDAMGGAGRGYMKRVQLDKNVAGTIEMNLHTVDSTLLIANTLGGPVVSASISGGFVHSITAGNYNTSSAILGISINSRKGDTHTWRYSGGRVNTMKISAQVGEVIKASFDMIFKDATLPTDDISASLSISSVLPLTFVGGFYRYAATEAAAATTTVEEPIQGFELTVTNNLVSDARARKLGSNVLQVLPATRREVQLTIEQRWDTTTSWNRFVQATQGSVELYLRGDSMGSSEFHDMTIRLPKVYMNSPEPTLDSATDILKSSVAFDVIVDSPSTITGKDIGWTIKNGVSAY